MSLKDQLTLWNDAVGAFDKGDYEKAMATFAEEDSAKFFFNTGLILMKLNRYEEAITAFTNAVERDVHLTVGFHARGIAYFRAGLYMEAAYDFAHSFETLRGNTRVDYSQLGFAFKLYLCEILHNKAVCSAYLGYPENAVQDLMMALDNLEEVRHNTISATLDAIQQNGGAGIDIFEIPEDILFRPSKKKVKDLKPKNHLGAAKVVAVYNESDNFVGFSGIRMKAARDAADAQHEADMERAHEIEARYDLPLDNLTRARILGQVRAERMGTVAPGTTDLLGFAVPGAAQNEDTAASNRPQASVRPAPRPTARARPVTMTGASAPSAVQTQPKAAPRTAPNRPAPPMVANVPPQSTWQSATDDDYSQQADLLQSTWQSEPIQSTWQTEPGQSTWQTEVAPSTWQSQPVQTSWKAEPDVAVDTQVPVTQQTSSSFDDEWNDGTLNDDLPPSAIAKPVVKAKPPVATAKPVVDKPVTASKPTTRPAVAMKPIIKSASVESASALQRDNSTTSLPSPGLRNNSSTSNTSPVPAVTDGVRKLSVDEFGAPTVKGSKIAQLQAAILAQSSPLAAANSTVHVTKTESPLPATVPPADIEPLIKKPSVQELRSKLASVLGGAEAAASAPPPPPVVKSSSWNPSAAAAAPPTPANSNYDNNSNEYLEMEPEANGTASAPVAFYKDNDLYDSRAGLAAQEPLQTQPFDYSTDYHEMESVEYLEMEADAHDHEEAPPPPVAQRSLPTYDAPPTWLADPSVKLSITLPPSLGPITVTPAPAPPRVSFAQFGNARAAAAAVITSAATATSAAPPPPPAAADSAKPTTSGSEYEYVAYGAMDAPSGTSSVFNTAKKNPTASTWVAPPAPSAWTSSFSTPPAVSSSTRRPAPARARADPITATVAPVAVSTWTGAVTTPAAAAATPTTMKANSIYGSKNDTRVSTWTSTPSATSSSSSSWNATATPVPVAVSTWNSAPAAVAPVVPAASTTRGNNSGRGVAPAAPPTNSSSWSSGVSVPVAGDGDMTRSAAMPISSSAWSSAPLTTNAARGFANSSDWANEPASVYDATANSVTDANEFYDDGSSTSTGILGIRQIPNKPLKILVGGARGEDIKKKLGEFAEQPKPPPAKKEPPSRPPAPSLEPEENYYDTAYDASGVAVSSNAYYQENGEYATNGEVSSWNTNNGDMAQQWNVADGAEAASATVDENNGYVWDGQQWVLPYQAGQEQNGYIWDGQQWLLPPHTYDTQTKASSTQDTPSSVSSSNKLKIKCRYRDVRMVIVPLDVTYSELKLAICAKFAARELYLSFKDSEDGDFIGINCNEDLHYAIEVSGGKLQIICSDPE